MTTAEVSKQLKDLAEQLDSLVADSEALLHTTTDEGGEPVKKIRERLAAALECAKATGRRVQDKTLELARTSDETVREHTYESLGLALGVGLLIGVLVGRR